MADSNFYDALATSMQGVEEQRATLEAAAAEARKAGQAMAASANGPQILPGTGGETAGSLLQRKQAELQAQQLTQKVARASDIENLMVILGQDLAANTKQSRELTAKIAQDSAVSLFDDPITAIANAFTIPWDEQALEGLNNQAEVANDRLMKLHAGVQQAAKTADLISEKVTASSLAEVATAAELLQAQTAAKARLDAARANGDAVTLALTADSKMLDLRLKERAARQQDAQFDLAMKREQRLLEAADKAAKKQEDEDLVDAKIFEYVNNALVADGKKPLEPMRYKVMKKGSAELIDSLYKKGLQLAINGEMDHGKTIEERFKYQALTAWTPTTPQQESIMLWQNEKRKEAATATNNKSIMQINADTSFATKFKDEQKNIREGSPFAAPSYSVIGNSAVGKNPLWQKYIVPTLSDANKGNSVDPNVIMSAAKQAVLDGTVKSKDAAAFVKDVFVRSIELNNAVHNFRKITGGLEQTRYGASVKVGSAMNILTPGFAKGTSTINMADPVEVQAALQRSISMELVGQLNTRREYPAGAGFDQGGNFYPPITKAGVITGAKQ